MAKIIGVDFDDVLVPTNETMSSWHNSVYGTSYQKEDIVSWTHLDYLWQCSREEKHRRIHEFFYSEEHATMVPVRGAEEALQILNEKGFCVVIITGRPVQFRKQTLPFVEKYFPSLLGHTHFTSKVIDGIVTDRPKAEFCEELAVEIFIDDHLQYVNNIAFAGIPVLLFDNPWNQTDDLPPNVERVYSWSEIVERLK